MAFALSKTSETLLSLCGLRVRVVCGDDELLRRLEFDFGDIGARLGPEEETLEISVHLEPIPWDIIPPRDEAGRGQQYVIYEEGTRRFVVYGRRVLLRFDYEANEASVYGDDRDALYERLYLFILSRIGEHLDCRALHRVHGLGFSFASRGVLFLIPQGGGKSTLALKLLEHGAVRIVSEDSPIINRRSEMIPFPFRFAVMRDELPAGIPSSFVRVQGEKALLSLRYFRDRIETSELPVSLIFCGKWTAAPEPSIQRISRLELFAVLCRDMVVGYGLAQLVELFLRNSWRDMFRKLALASSRTLSACMLSVRAEPYRLLLCRDDERNAQLVLSFLAEKIRPLRKDSSETPSKDV